MGNTMRSKTCKRMFDAAEEVLGFSLEAPEFPEQCANAAVSLIDVRENDVIVVGLRALAFLPELLDVHPSATFCVLMPELPADCDARAAAMAIEGSLRAELVRGQGDFLGIFDDADALCGVCGGRRLKLLDATRNSPGELDPLYAYQADNPFWRVVREQQSSDVSAVLLWACANANERGYRKGQWPIGEIDANGLRAVIELPVGMGGWLFVWAGSEMPSVMMVDARNAHYSVNWRALRTAPGDQGIYAADVAPADIFVNGWNYTPDHYAESCVRADAVPLGSLARHISRGTTLSGKKLSKRGFASDRASAGGHGVALMPGPRGRGPVLVREDDVFYLDTSSILEDGKIDPQIIDDIPAGQERYVVTREDGRVLLIPRTGQNVALYRPAVPTLISNNLFVVFLPKELSRSRYYQYALGCEFVNEQVAKASKPLTKEQVANIVIPVVPQEVRDAIVSCRQKRDQKVGGLLQEVWELEHKSAFQLWQEGFGISD